MKSHSFVLQFLQRLEGEFAGQWRGYSDAVSMVDITNTSRSLTNVQWHCYSLDHDWCVGMEAASGDDGYGIVVGTGTSAPTNVDYVLQTKIAHGNAASQLQYASTSVGGAGLNGANVDMIISRMFVNGSGGTVTLKEIGVYVKSAGPSVYTFLFMRDAVNQTINNGEVALVSYDMRTTV